MEKIKRNWQVINIADQWSKIVIAVIVVLALGASSGVALGALNPSVVYCNELGYDYITRKTSDGEYGICRFPDGSEVGAWDFLTGKVGQEYNYCQQNGYGQEIIESTRELSCPDSNECLVCILADGTKVEVTDLMDLNTDEGVCGDGACVFGEDYEDCPQDCPSGFFDLYCDGVADGLCDPDCTSETDPDCTKEVAGMDIAVCADEKCFQKSRSFVQGETVYFKINNYSNPTGSATVKTPSGEIKQVTFKKNLAIFQSDEIGKFSLWVNIFRGEYKGRKIEKDFVYVGGIEESPVCIVDGKCEGEENKQNCPQDCSSATNIKFYILVAVILLIIIIVGIVIYRRKAKAKNI